MSKLKNIENAGRQAWLASIGVYGAGWKYATNKIDSTYAKTNDFINELISDGEIIEKELQEKLKFRAKIDSRIDALKNKLGISESSDEQKIELLTAKVDTLTVSVTKLLKARQVKSKVTEKAKQVVKTATKTPVKKAVVTKKK